MNKVLHKVQREHKSSTKILKHSPKTIKFLNCMNKVLHKVQTEHKSSTKILKHSSKNNQIPQLYE